MKVPTHIGVGGKRIPIEVCDLSDSDGALGMYDADRRVIRLDKSVLDDRRLLRDTLTHEAIHCALDLAGLSYTSTGLLSHKLEEQVVTVMESLAAPAIVRISRI